MSSSIKRLSVRAVAVLVLLGTGTAFAASQSSSSWHIQAQAVQPQNIHDPETVKVEGPLPQPVPFLAAPDSANYIPQAAGITITSPNNVAIAQLAHPPADLAEIVAANFPPADTLKADQVGYTVLASIRYTGSSHIVLVTTTRPSTAADQRVVILGSETIYLDNGVKAWATSNLQHKTSNRIVFVQDNLLIMVAGDLQLDKLKQLASDVIIGK